MEFRKGLIFLLIGANIVLTSYLSYTSLANAEQLCISGQGCDVIQNSPYSKIMGIPLAYLGLTTFIALFLTYLLAYKKEIRYELFLLMVFVNLIFSVYLIYIQIYVIKAICSNCLATDLFTLIITILAVYEYFGQKRKTRR